MIQLETAHLKKAKHLVTEKIIQHTVHCVVHKYRKNIYYWDGIFSKCFECLRQDILELILTLYCREFNLPSFMIMKKVISPPRKKLRLKVCQGKEQNKARQWTNENSILYNVYYCIRYEKLNVKRDILHYVYFLNPQWQCEDFHFIIPKFYFHVIHGYFFYLDSFSWKYLIIMTL